MASRRRVVRPKPASSARSFLSWASAAGGGVDDVTVDAGASTFALADYDITADGVTSVGFTVVARNEAAETLAGKAVTVAGETVEVSAANSTVTTDVTEIADDGTEVANITLTLRDASDRPIPDIPASDCVLAVSGTGNTVTQPTGVTSLVGGTITGSFVSTNAEAKTASFTVKGVAITDTAAVTVSLNGSGDPGAVFESSWSTATGTTESALGDGGVWPSLGCPDDIADILTVIAGAGVGWTRTANVLRCLFSGAGPCGMLEKSDAVPLSTTHYGMFWIRNDDSGSKNDHPVAYNNLHFSGLIQGVPFTRHANSPLGGSHPTEWYTAVVINGSKNFSPALDNETWYRFEWQTEYVTATTVKFHPRIYSDAGTLLYTASDFIYAAGGYANLQAAYDDGVVHTLTDAELARDWGMGQEGPGGQPDTGGYFYYGAVRLGTAGWFNGNIGSLT